MKNSILLITFSLSLIGFSQTNSEHLNLNSSNVAISGYDVTSYFTHNKAIEGSKKYSANFKNTIYYFVSAENKELFLKEPEKYLPQYGGWCAYAMGAKSEKVSINPESFIVSNEKLYLFYKTYFNDTSEKWNEDSVNLKNKADRNWKNTIKNY
jgi:YHS domain-containing protein